MESMVHLALVELLKDPGNFKISRVFCFNAFFHTHFQS